MTKERLEKELQKIYVQLEQLQEKRKNLEEQKQMAEDAEMMKIIKKRKISPEFLQALNCLNEKEILQMLEQKGETRK